MATLSSLAVPIALTFGGCCSNVFSLEAVLRQAPQVSSFLTLIQFAFVALQTLPGQLTFVRRKKVRRADGEVVTIEETGWLPRLKERKVPLKRWAGTQQRLIFPHPALSPAMLKRELVLLVPLVQVILFLSVSWLNNLAFSYNGSFGLPSLSDSFARASDGFLSNLLSTRRPPHHLSLRRPRSLHARQPHRPRSSVRPSSSPRCPTRLCRSHHRDSVSTSSTLIKL
jgi:hypothetical protein